jgi:hypothetical protein
MNVCPSIARVGFISATLRLASFCAVCFIVLHALCESESTYMLLLVVVLSSTRFAVCLHSPAASPKQRYPRDSRSSTSARKSKRAKGTHKRKKNPARRARGRREREKSGLSVCVECACLRVRALQLYDSDF